MFVLIELICSLVTYSAVTGSEKTTRLVYLTITITALILAGLLLGNIWALLTFLPILAGFGVLIGLTLGVSVNLLSSKVDRSISKLAIWLCGIALLVLLSFHSKYRSTYESLTACNDQALDTQTVSVVFKGLKDSPFEMVLDPAFASISVWTERRGSFLLGQSNYEQNLTGSKLRPVACDLTRNFSRPIRLEDYTHTIRIDNETGELLEPEKEQVWDSYSYIPIRFGARNGLPPFDQVIVAQNGQLFRIKFKPHLRENWRFYTDYYGLSMAFDLSGEASKPPVEQASLVFEVFKSLGYFVPAKSGI